MVNAITIELSYDDVKLLINALHQYRRKINPTNPKAIGALSLIDRLKSKLPGDRIC